MKEITIFCPTIGVGGVEKNLYLILNYLAKQKLKINLLTCSFDKKTKFNKRIKLIGPHNKKFCKSTQIVKIFICLFYFLKTDLIEKKTILFSFQSNIFMIIFAYFFNLKIIARINASPDYYLNNYIKKIFFSKIYKHANIVIVNSNDLKKKVKQFLKINSIVIYNPSYNKKKNKLFLKSRTNFKNKNYISLLNVGRLVHQKNQILLIKTMRYLKSNTKLTLKLNIIGNGNLFNFLKNKISENNLNSDIKIIKNITNPSRYFKNSDYFILSSLYEGLPNALIEAISYKNITLSSDCPTGPREILLNGKAGYLFKNNDHIQLAKTLIRSIENKKQNLEKINLAYQSLDRFDEEKNCKKYLIILNKFIYD
jgi:glycosyltransferase involved in cell wall biosynthesis